MVSLAPPAHPQLTTTHTLQPWCLLPHQPTHCSPPLTHHSHSVSGPTSPPTAHHHSHIHHSHGISGPTSPPTVHHHSHTTATVFLTPPAYPKLTTTRTTATVSLALQAHPQLTTTHTPQPQCFWPHQPTYNSPPLPTIVFGPASPPTAHHHWHTTATVSLASPVHPQLTSTHTPQPGCIRRHQPTHRGRSLDTIERHLQQAVNSIQEWATRNGFRFAAHKCKVVHFTAPRSRAQRPPIVRIGNSLLPVEESTKFLGLWWDSHLSFKKHISVLKTQCKEALNLIRVVAHLKWGGDRDTLLMLYRAIVRSKFDYGCIVYGTASNTNLRQLDSIHNSGLRLALGAFCTSPVSSLYTEANEAPLEERRLKLSMHYYVKTRACIDNPAHHALHEFDRTTRDLYVPRPNGRGGMTRPPAPPIGLKVEEAMTSAEINAELVCPLMTPNFPPGTHDYDPKRHDLIEGVSKCMISGQEAQAKFNEFREAQGSHDEVYTDGSKMNEKVGAAAVINRHFQNGETTCRQLSKRLPDNSTIFAAEATAISLALNYYQHMGPVHHDVVVYSDSMSCLQAIEGEDTENPFICHIMNLLWSLSDKGTRVRFCWVPSHCGIDGNERVDQLAKETLDQDIDPLANVHYTDMKPLVNSYTQKLVQTKWDVAVHGRDLYLVKPTLGPPKKFQHLTRAEEVVITRLRIGHTKATKSHILSRGPPTGCHHCGETLTIDHMLLECALLQECRDEYYTVHSLNALFETIPETCIVEFLREAGFFYLIWCNSLTSTSPQTFTIWSDLSNYLENESNSETHLLV